MANLPDVLIKYELDPNGISLGKRNTQLKSRLKLQRKYFDGSAAAMAGIARTLALLAMPYALAFKIKAKLRGGKSMSAIVHVVESFGAGTLSMVSAIANAQSQDGHQVTVIHSVREETPAGWRDLFVPAVNCIHLPMQRAIHPLNDFRTGRALFKWIASIAPDVVLCIPVRLGR
ncbi:hypothetical protein GKO28_06600 [Deefgea sp. CFH1-16]|nr:hypothetical protein [Deefgea sp. CFH1-16]